MKETRFSYIKSITTLFYILLGGQVFLACTLFVLVYFGKLELFPWKYSPGILVILGMSISIICRFTANYLYKQKLHEIINSETPIKKKLEDYLTANIQRWAIMEFAILFCIILVYLSGNMLLMVVTAAMIFLFLLSWPRSKKIIADLDIEM